MKERHLKAAKAKEELLPAFRAVKPSGPGLSRSPQTEQSDRCELEAQAS